MRQIKQAQEQARRYSEDRARLVTRNTLEYNIGKTQEHFHRIVQEHIFLCSIKINVN